MNNQKNIDPTQKSLTKEYDRMRADSPVSYEEKISKMLEDYSSLSFYGKGFKRNTQKSLQW